MDNHAAVLERLQKRGAISERAHERSTRQHEAIRKLLLIRHGATRLNAHDISVDRIRGHSDVPLSPEGRQEAEHLAHQLKGDKRPDVLVASDLKRAFETAEIISRITRIPLLGRNKAFRPWDVGVWTGKVTREAIPHLHHYACDRPHEPIPDGESFDAFKARFFRGLDELFGRLKDDVVPAVIAHHRNERTLASWKADGYPTDGSIKLQEFTKRGEPTGAICVFEIAPQRLAAAARRMGKS
jgi:broad specificity phosphatase PhoE